MNDDFQDAKFIKEENGHLYFELITYPDNEVNKNFNDWKEDPNWLTNDKKNLELQQYLKPGITSNWDNALKNKILSDFKAYGGYDIESVKSDKLVVKTIAYWLERTKTKGEGMLPTEFFLKVKDGKLFVPDDFINAFHNEKDVNLKKLGYNSMNDDDYIKHTICGKEMYYQGVRQTCSSAATLINTVMRAIGIPSRIILTYTSYDFSNKQEVDLANNLQNDTVKNKIFKSYAPGGIGDHFFNEVYIGGRWIRLNDDNFGDNDPNVGGMAGRVRVYTANDFTDFNMLNWFNNDGKPKEIPYHALEMSDMYGVHKK
jgi:hypothetical protein